jgi:hypothetical protein
MKSSKIPELLEKINRTAKDADFKQLAKLDYDLLMQNLRDLYEAIDEARNNPANEEVIVIVPQPVRKKLLNPNEGILLTNEVAPPAPEVKTEQPVVQKTVTPTPVVTEVKQQQLAEPPVEKVVVKEPVVQVTEKKPEPVNKTTTPVTSINEKIQGSTSLNDKLKAGTTEIHRRLSVRPLKDLIDLNKRFVIQNELFKGNADAMAAAVQFIDSAQDITTAETYLNNEVAPKLAWDETSQAVRMFRKLVKQKFGEE